MTKRTIAVAEVLIDIEAELRCLQLWESARPDAELLASVQPFAVDTLSFPQWLQFIFIPRMYAMIEAEIPLPTTCGMTPMAQEFFSMLPLHSAPLIAHLQRMDELLSKE